jgi:hypothetical protein
MRRLAPRWRYEGDLLIAEEKVELLLACPVNDHRNGGWSMPMRRFLFASTLLITVFSYAVNATVTRPPSARIEDPFQYKLLATSKTSTMEKEMNEAAAAGFRFETVMGGETSFGGSEAVVIMSRNSTASSRPKYEYKLLATSKTSTMQKELQQAGDAGFEFRGQTVFSSTFGGKEVVVILERNPEEKPIAYEYRLLATNRTSTMQKELQVAAAAGYRFVGMTVATSAFGGKEVIVITRKLIP